MSKVLAVFGSNDAVMLLALYLYALSPPLVMYSYSEVVFTLLASRVGSPSKYAMMKILTDYSYRYLS